MLGSHVGRIGQLELGPEIWSNADGLVFTTEVGTPIDPSNMNRRLAKVTEAVGLGRWSMTELARHSAASLLSDAGVPLELIAAVANVPLIPTFRENGDETARAVAGPAYTVPWRTS